MTLTNSSNSYPEDTTVVRDAQGDALDQAQEQLQGVDDARASSLWRAATQEMEKALAQLKAASNSPAALPEALAAEQAAYQALLKLQEHEYSVVRSRNRNQQGGGGSREQQLQRQLEQMDLTQSENRYENQRQAQPQQNNERREQLQVMNRLQELARRQQDLNERFKELQTALQEAKTEEEREEIRRRLKRLQEEQQQMLADLDEVRQRMDRPENQSEMADERRQLDQTRDDLQRASDAAAQGSPSQALASGTRAQRQLQEMRDQMRKQNSSKFAEDMRQMRAQSRELAREQEEILKKLNGKSDSSPETGSGSPGSESASAPARQQRRTLSDSPNQQEALDKLARQQERMTNLVEAATQVSQQAEEAEPLLSRQLYDTLRKFSQDSSKSMKETEEDLLRGGMVSPGLYEQLKESSRPDGQRLLDLTSEMLREGFLSQARQTGQRSQAAIDEFKNGIERAAQNLLGDDTEALRLAQQELDQLTEQLQREISRSQGSSTNQSGSQAGAANGRQGTNQTAAAGQSRGTNQLGQVAGTEGTNVQGTARSGTELAQSDNANSGQSSDGAQPGAQSEQTPGDRPRSGRQGNQPQPSATDQQPANGEQAANGERGQQGQQPGQQGQQPGQQGQQPGQPQGKEGSTGSQSGSSPNSPNSSQGDQGGQAETAQATDPDGNPSRGGATRDTLRRGRNLSFNPGTDQGGALSSGNWERLLTESVRPLTGPITGDDFTPWSDRLRDVEEMVDLPELRNEVAAARERARLLRQQFRREKQKPDWAVVQLQVVKPLVEVRDRIAEELARRNPNHELVPIDRDPVPNRYSDLVRRYYEELGKSNQQ